MTFSHSSPTSGLVLAMSSASRLCVALCLCVSVYTSVVRGKPTIYAKNENDKLEPVLVAVSSTVIPLPVYRVSYGVGVLGTKLPLPNKPAGDYKLVTVKKKGGGKSAGSPIKTQTKEEMKMAKDIL